MFLSSISKTCADLGFYEESEEFSAALSSILTTTSHTNTMMWIGKMQNSPLDLSGQGQLLKHGTVAKKFFDLVFKLGRKSSLEKSSSRQLFLFQKALVLCKIKESFSDPNNPHLIYEQYIT